MNILVLNYEFPPLGGGAAPVARDISYYLQKKGHKVTVVTMGYLNLPEYEEYEGMRVFRLKCLRSKKNECKPWEQYTYLLAVKRFMKQHIKENNYDICHTHFVIPTGEVARYIKKKYHIPYVITAHGSDVEGHNSKTTMKIMHFFLRYGWRRIVDNAICVISPSSYLKGLMEKNYPKGNYGFIPNGIDWDRYYALANESAKEKRILVMGRLQKFKNVQTILSALSNCRLSDWRVDILGDGPYREELERLCKELNLQEKVTFYGWIDNKSEEQLDIIKRASIYITASKFENCPMAVIEAVTAGCYPLLSDIPAHRQLINKDECFFEANNHLQLSDKLSEAIEKKESNSLGVIDTREYDWGNILSRYEEVFDQGIKKAKV